MREITILDGGFGTMLQRSEIPLPTPPEEVNVTAPELVADIHAQYVRAGSQIVMANTFGLSGKKVERSAWSVEALAEGALRAARRAAGSAARVALDIGPTGELLEPYGGMTEQAATARFARLIAARGDAELICIETMTDLREACLALRAAKAGCHLPVFVSMTFQSSGRTLMGDTPEQIMRTLEAEGADAVGMNCSLGPRESLPIFRQLAACAHVPLIAKPNAGMPDPVSGAYPMDAQTFAACMLEFVAAGAGYVGGCCGTTPAYIEALCAHLKEA